MFVASGPLKPQLLGVSSGCHFLEVVELCSGQFSALRIISATASFTPMVHGSARRLTFGFAQRGLECGNEQPGRLRVLVKHLG